MRKGACRPRRRNSHFVGWVDKPSAREIISVICWVYQPSLPHWNDLKLNDTKAGQAFLYRYRRRDDFGQPGSAFLICSFWLVQALAKTGRLAQATAVMNEALHAANPLGLLSEHYAHEHALQLGNFPQAYSHVGQINAAFAVSPPWSEVL